jgi:preprotein translocase subunit SecF
MAIKMSQEAETIMKVKLWPVFVGMFSILGFFFLFSFAIQERVDAKQDTSIEKKLDKEQYYRDIANISERLNEISKDVKCQPSNYRGNLNPY